VQGVLNQPLKISQAMCEVQDQGTQILYGEADLMYAAVIAKCSATQFHVAFLR
jgi:hypothetical protein